MSTPTEKARGNGQVTTGPGSLKRREGSTKAPNGKLRIGDTVLAADLIPGILKDIKVRMERGRA